MTHGELKRLAADCKLGYSVQEMDMSFFGSSNRVTIYVWPLEGGIDADVKASAEILDRHVQNLRQLGSPPCTVVLHNRPEGA